MKRILQILFIVPVLYIAAAPFYLRSKTIMMNCGGLNIIVSDSAENRFTGSSEIRERIARGSVRYSGVPLYDVSLDEIERSLASSITELRTTEAYFTIDGILHVEVDQRNPILRVKSSSGSEYYIDDEGYIIRKRGLHPPRLHIAAGSINIRDFSGSVLNVDAEDVPAIFRDLYELVRYIRGKEILAALVDQIVVGPGGDIFLIPRTGGHRILLGDTSDLEMKFYTLISFYDQVMTEGAWDRYNLINLKYTGQVVCRRK